MRVGEGLRLEDMLVTTWDVVACVGALLQY